MKPLQPADPPTETGADLKAKMGHQHPEKDDAYWENEAARMRESSFWLNDEYQVQRMLPDSRGIVHVSIKRLDGGTNLPWRDKQAIKNHVLGPECEAVELFPAESRLADSVNQFHLWGSMDPDFRFPIGFNSGRLVRDGTGRKDPRTNTTQAPLPLTFDQIEKGSKFWVVEDLGDESTMRYPVRAIRRVKKRGGGFRWKCRSEADPTAPVVYVTPETEIERRKA